MRETQSSTCVEHNQIHVKDTIKHMSRTQSLTCQGHNQTHVCESKIQQMSRS